MRKPHATLTAAIVAASATTATLAAPTVTPLGQLGGGTFSRAHDINNNGQIVGEARLTNGLFHGFLFENNRMLDLSPDAPLLPSNAWGINDHGQIVGEFGGTTADPNTTGEPSATLWHNGVRTDLGPLLGAKGTSTAQAINNDGVIAGRVSFDNNFSLPAVFNTSGDLLMASTLPGNDGGNLLGINEQGVAVGYDFRFFTPDNAVVAGPDRDGNYSQLAPLPEATGGGSFRYSQAMNINDNNIIVGTSNNGSGTESPAVWTVNEQGGVDLDFLPKLPGLEGGVAFDINESDVIVGWAFTLETDAPQRAWMYADGVLTDLNDFLDPNSRFEYLLGARGINDHGDIVGWGLTKEGTIEGFVLTGVPSPSSLALASVAGLAASRRRRGA